MANAALLPSEALAHWRALEGQREEDVDPALRVRRWVERLRARMLGSSGRLGGLLVATGLCDLDAIAECVRAQLDAGTAGDSQLLHDVEVDLRLLTELGPIPLVEELAAKVATLDWLPNSAGYIEGDLATRLLEAGRGDESEAALARITWHRPLLDWLERHPGSLGPDVHARLVARAEHLVTNTHLAPEYQVELFVELGVLARDPAWLDRARQVLTTLSPEQLEASGSVEPLASKLACGHARLGAFDEAMAVVAALAPDDRWSALARLAPIARDEAVRAGIVDELVAGVVPFEQRWWQLVDALPETIDRALEMIKAIPDEGRRLEELGVIVSYLADAGAGERERARRICAWMLGVAGRDPSSPTWAERWRHVVDALTDGHCEALLDDDRRRELIDALLARLELDLWPEAAAFVPDDRASAVLELSCARLSVANHYSERDKWIEVGLPLLARVPAVEADRWREIAAVQMAGTNIAGYGIERLAAWSPEQQRAMVLARLAQHQHEFLPEWLVEPWRNALRGRSSIAPATDPEERAEARRALEALTATTAWPTFEQVTSVFTQLERCTDADVLAAVLADVLR